MADVSVEELARSIWDIREATFPARVRMKWADGTLVAQEATLAVAHNLLSKYRIERR